MPPWTKSAQAARIHCELFAAPVAAVIPVSPPFILMTTVSIRVISWGTTGCVSALFESPRQVASRSVQLMLMLLERLLSVFNLPLQPLVLFLSQSALLVHLPFPLEVLLNRPLVLRVRSQKSVLCFLISPEESLCCR